MKRSQRDKAEKKRSDSCPSPPLSPPPSHPTPPHFSPTTLRPFLKSHTFSRSYSANLPTSLTNIMPKTRGFSPLKPAADICTTWLENYSIPLIFMKSRKGWENDSKSWIIFWGLFVDLTVKVINNKLGSTEKRKTPRCRSTPHPPDRKQLKDSPEPVAQPRPPLPLLSKFPFFLLNREDISTPSFLLRLKVLFRHRKYIIPNAKQQLPTTPPGQVMEF